MTELTHAEVQIVSEERTGTGRRGIAAFRSLMGYRVVGAPAIVAAIALLGITLSVVASVASPDGDEGRVYTNRTVKGRWGFGGGGHGVAVPDPAPAAGVGTMTFDGMGGCAVTSTVNLEGTLIGPIRSQACSYQVNPDGTGLSAASFGAPEFPDPVRILFVIVDRANELFIINVDLFVAGYTAKRM